MCILDIFYEIETGQMIEYIVSLIYDRIKQNFDRRVQYFELVEYQINTVHLSIILRKSCTYVNNTI